MKQALVIVLTSFRISEQTVGFDNLLKKMQALRPYAVRMVPLHQLSEGLANPTGALSARDPQHHVVTLPSHKADS
jgi:hypothetical protein